jgi:hypothetical protein
VLTATSHAEQGAAYAPDGNEIRVPGKNHRAFTKVSLFKGTMFKKI